MSSDRGFWRILITVFLLAFAARTAWGLVRHAQAPGWNRLEFPDEDQYWMMAKSLSAGEGLRDELGFRAGRMPLYPVFLALFAPLENGVAAAKTAQWVLGALAAPLTAALGMILGGRRLGLLAGFLVAIDPFLLFFSSLLLTETLAVTSLCALWLVAARTLANSGQRLIEWIAVGTLAAICVYLRESMLGLIFLLLAFAVAAARGTRMALAGSAVSLMVVVISLIPWAARNKKEIGEWCWLTTRGGISLYDGVHPQATGASDLGDIKNAPEVAALSETQRNRYFQRESWRAIRDDPQRIFRLMGRKLVRLWNPFPNVKAYRSSRVRWISMAWNVPLFLAAAAGVVLWTIKRSRQGAWAAAFLLLPAIYVSAIHSLFIGSIRYRLPAMPMIAVLAASAWMFVGEDRRDGPRTVP